jgi:hypothetical protein
MASEIDHSPLLQPPPPINVPTDDDDLSHPIANGKPTTATPVTNATIAAPHETPNRAPLFADTTSDASASDADGGADSESTSSRVVSPITSPPYWMMNVANTNGNTLHPQTSHNRTASVESVLPAGAITLQDNEDGSSDAGNGDANIYGRDRNRACWAKSVEVVSHVVVNGSATNIGAFVVWNIRVETLTVSLLVALDGVGMEDKVGADWTRARS